MSSYTREVTFPTETTTAGWGPGTVDLTRCPEKDWYTKFYNATRNMGQLDSSDRIRLGTALMKFVHYFKLSDKDADDLAVVVTQVLASGRLDEFSFHAMAYSTWHMSSHAWSKLLDVPVATLHAMLKEKPIAVTAADVAKVFYDFVPETSTKQQSEKCDLCGWVTGIGISLFLWAGIILAGIQIWELVK